MRLFIGVELPDEVRAACAAWMDQARPWVDARFALPENLHITLAFLGETDPARPEALSALMKEMCARFAPPMLRVGAADVFPKRGGGILHLRVETADTLAAMHDALCAALRARDFPCDPGPFSPHVTLARKVKSLRLPSIPTPEAAFVPERLTLFESARDSEGVLRYTPVLRCGWQNEI